MTVGDALRKQNKHRKIVLHRHPGNDSFTVMETHNTLDPPVNRPIQRDDAQKYIDDGYTVVVKGKP